MKYAALATPSSADSPSAAAGSGSRIVPGTMAMASSLARAWYRARYGVCFLASARRIAESAFHEERWYSGRTARFAPCEAALRMYDSARAKLPAMSRGYSTHLKAQKVSAWCVYKRC